MTNIVNKLPDEDVNISKSHVILRAFILLISLTVVVYSLLYAVINILVLLNKEKIHTICREKLSEEYCVSELSNESNNIQKLVNDLLQQTNYNNNIKACVYDFSDKNAFASCGDIIIVSKKLYDDAKEINDLGFVLAHEISHITNGDIKRIVSRALSQVLTLFIFSLNSDSEISNFVSSQLLFNSNFYTRKQELRADKTAIKIIKRKYEDMYPTLKFFENLSKENESIKDDVSIIDYYFNNKTYNEKDAHNFLSIYMNHFGTHPAYQKRMESIIEAIKDNNINE